MVSGHQQHGHGQDHGQSPPQCTLPQCPIPQPQSPSGKPSADERLERLVNIRTLILTTIVQIIVIIVTVTASVARLEARVSEHDRVIQEQKTTIARVIDKAETATVKQGISETKTELILEQLRETNARLAAIEQQMRRAR